MLTTILVGKLISLFLVILFGCVNAIRIMYANNIPIVNVFWFSIGLTIFIFLQFMI